MFVAVCSQFSRGVFSMLGAVSPDSFDTLHSYSNTFQMPFVTPWFPEKVNSTFFFFSPSVIKTYNITADIYSYPSIPYIPLIFTYRPSMLIFIIFSKLDDERGCFSERVIRLSIKHARRLIDTIISSI